MRSTRSSAAGARPGFILTVTAMRPGEDIREALGGNLCRCGCYVKIEEAVRACVS